MIETALYTKLSTTAGITAITARIYAGYAAQGAALPYIVFNKVGKANEIYMGSLPAAIATSRIQIDCWASTFEGAKALADKVRLALDSWSTTGVNACYLVDDGDDIEESPEYGAVRSYCARQDYEICHTETTS